MQKVHDIILDLLILGAGLLNILFTSPPDNLGNLVVGYVGVGIGCFGILRHLTKKKKVKGCRSSGLKGF